MIAYKFLSTGATGPFTGFRWPLPAGDLPGEWVEAPDQRPDRGIHACRVEDLAFWQDAELWRAELADPIVEGHRQVIAARGRLLERVVGWHEALARSFGEACVWRARDFAMAALLRAGCAEEPEHLSRCRSLPDLHRTSKEASSGGGPAANLAEYLVEAIDFLLAGDAACSTYISARAAVIAAGGEERAFAAEREEQARWLAERLGLAPSRSS